MPYHANMDNLPTVTSVYPSNVTNVTSVYPSNLTTNVTYIYPRDTVILSGCSCALSLLGAGLILFTYCSIPEIRNVTRKLVLWLTLADTLTAIGYLIAVVRYSASTLARENSAGTTLCLLQSIITTYSSLVSFFLTVFVALHITLCVFLHTNWTSSLRYLVTVNVISWAVPAVIVSAAVSMDELGEDEGGLAGTGPWCWINTSRGTGLGPIFWMVLTGKGWEILCYILTTFFYFLLKIRLYIGHRDDGVFYALHASVRREDNNFLYVWFVLYLLRIWGTIRFIVFAVNFRSRVSLDPLYYMVVLQYLQAIGDPLQAFCNAILVCLLDGTVRRILWQKMTSCLTSSETSSALEDSVESQLINSESSDYEEYNRSRQLSRRHLVR